MRGRRNIIHILAKNVGAIATCDSCGQQSISPVRVAFETEPNQPIYGWMHSSCAERQLRRRPHV